MASWTEPDEAALVERLKARDEKAFNELVRGLQRRVFGLLFRMLGNRTEAEDITQEVFVHVFKSIDQFRGESRISSWVMRIATNLCKNRYIHDQRHHSKEHEDITETADRVPMASAKGTTAGSIAQPDELAMGFQMERIIQQAIAAMDADQREILILRDIEDMSHEEISEIIGIPIATVKSRILRARQRLREIVERRTGERLK